MTGSDGNHIDRYFREGLAGYEPAPPEKVWGRIEGRLTRKKPAVFWLYRAAAAAAVLLLVVSSLWMLRRSPEPARETPLARNQEQIRQETTPAQTGPVESRKEVAEPARKISRPLPVTAPASPTQTGQELQPVSVPFPAATTENLLASVPERESPSAAAGPEPMSLLALSSPVVAGPDERFGLKRVDLRQQMNEALNTNLYYETPVEKASRWEVGGQFSPVYSYRYLTSKQGNEDLKKYYDQIEEGVFAYSGGINLNYQASRKIMVYTGLYFSQMGLTINQVGEFTLSTMGWETSDIHRIIAEKFYLVDHSTGTIVSGNKNLKIVNNPEQAIYNSNFGRDPQGYTMESLENADAQILQNYEFLEIPLILRYRVVDSKVGMNLLGGVSTNFLVRNEASLFIDGINYSTITTSNVNSLNYSGTVGLGMDFEILPGLKFNVEPTFKYYLNTFSEKNLIGSHPYSVAVFSGVRYRF